MAVTARVYGKALLSLAQKKADLSADTIKVMLASSAYVPDQDAHQFKADVTNEVTGTGWPAGGVALTGVTLAYDGASNTLKLDAADLTVDPSSVTARFAVFYDATPGSDATRPLLCWWDFGEDRGVTNGPLTLTFDAAGIVTASVA